MGRENEGREMTRREQQIANIKKWSLHRGKNELLRHLEGGKALTMGEAIAAKCYDCMGGYPEGTEDCRIDHCPLHDFSPYREGGPRKSRTFSDEQKAKMAERMRNARA